MGARGPRGTGRLTTVARVDDRRSPSEVIGSSWNRPPRMYPTILSCWLFCGVHSHRDPPLLLVSFRLPPPQQRRRPDTRDRPLQFGRIFTRGLRRDQPRPYRTATEPLPAPGMQSTRIPKPNVPFTLFILGSYPIFWSENQIPFLGPRKKQIIAFRGEANHDSLFEESNQCLVGGKPTVRLSWKTPESGFGHRNVRTGSTIEYRSQSSIGS